MKTLVLNSHEFAHNDNRLRASSYSPEAYAARRRLKRSGFPLVSLASPQAADNVFMPGRFKRIWVEEAYGVPFITGAEMLLAKLPRNKFISKKLTKQLDTYFVEEGWTLISRSGTVGNAVIVTSDLTDYAVTEDAIRVVPAEEMPAGYLYAYLRGKDFYALATEKVYGSVIDHIEPNQVAGLPIPLLPDTIQQHIHELVMTSCDLRVRANAKLRLADERFHQTNNLPRLPKPTSRSQVLTITSASFDNRLDGSYHNLQARLAVTNIRHHTPDYKPLGQLASTYLPTRFARVYVDDPHYGVPFLSSKQILQAEPVGVPYLSRKLTKRLENYLVEEGWILITRSGTVGRVGYVSQDIAESAVSEHVIRIIPGPEVHPGYLYAAVASDYGYYQATRHIHGSVVDELTTDQTDSILIPLPNSADETQIGELVIKAMNMRALANVLLRRARTLFGAVLKAGQAAFVEINAAHWLASWERSTEGTQE
jgi:type I restriction enzyme S subunit